MDWIEGSVAATLFGFLGGLLLGLAARRGRFCTLGALEDALYGADWARIRMWAVALAVTITGTFALAAVDLVDLDSTLYARVAWNPASSIAGGLIFGYGMAIAGNCGYGALARLGGGDLRSLVIVIVMGIAAYATIAGPLSALRVALFPPLASDGGGADGYAHLLSRTIGIQPLGPALLVSAGLLAWALKDYAFRHTTSQIFWAVVVGVAILSGWLGTSLIARESLDIVAVESHSFTRPLGESVLFLMTSSGMTASFTIGSVAGVIIGAVIGSISRGHFRWEACDDPGELGRQILGGALMGIGGVLALGCSVGQGLTAFSTLTFSAPVVLAAIAAGAALGLRHLIRGFNAQN